MFTLMISLAVLVSPILGHGMLLDPVNRSSRWRYDSTAKRNYDDNGLFCGGFAVQWVANGGKCGLCGDNYANARPRANELGGTYGQQGVIVGHYQQGGLLPVSVFITANHRGYFTFNLCALDGNSGVESEDCFVANSLKTIEGNTKYYMNSTNLGWYNTTLLLPADVSCSHCVLQWTYTTGNSWGLCENGMGALGCGRQENFRTCSDILIKPTKNN